MVLEDRMIRYKRVILELVLHAPLLEELRVD